MNSIVRSFVIVAVGVSSLFATEDELAEISRKLDNPLAKLWSLTFQENVSINSGDLVEESTISNTLFFQPALPISVGENLVFTARPVFPVVTVPDLGTDFTGGTHVTGFGDIQLLTVVGPGNAKGSVWGVGGTFVFPTASDELLGTGKYQAGPAAMFFHFTQNWSVGLFVQQWWSYAGDDTRKDISRLDIQYVIRRSLGTWSLGMGPTVKINWSAESGENLTFPIGLGVTKTVRLGKVPVKMRFEPQYSIIVPDSYGSRWNFRLQFSPVIPNPFGA